MNMKRASLRVSLSIFLALNIGVGARTVMAQDTIRPEDRVPGLAGWHVQEGSASVWRYDGKVISTIAGKGGFLTMDQQYGDFELKLEYRIQTGGNSGIGVHYPPGGHPSTTGIEIQILDDDAPKHKGLKPAQYNGSIYKHVAPKSRAAKPPGKWNKLEIRCKDPWITVKLNGVEIQHVNRNDYPMAESTATPLAKLPRKGCIGLQSHDDPVEFRAVKIKQL
jgi:hypothetical protein